MERDIGAAADGRRVAVVDLAPVVENAVEATELRRTRVGGVPAIGAPGDDFQGPPFATSADPQRQTVLQGLWPACRVVDLEVATGIRRALVAEHAPDDLRGLVEHVEPGANVGERVAVGRSFPDVPAGTEAEFEASAGKMIQRGCRLGEERGVPVSDVEHEAADPRVLGIGGQGAKRCQGLVVRLGAALEGCLVEVVPNGNPVDARRVQATPKRTHLGHGEVLLADVDAEGNGHERTILGLLRANLSRRLRT